jgi:hypothetical protein
MACQRLVQRQYELLFTRQEMHCEELGGRRASAPGARWSAATCDALEHGEAQDWHVTLPAWAIAEASRELMDNDVVAVLGAGIVMMVKWEIWGVPAARREMPRHARGWSSKARPQVREEYPGEAARHRALFPNPLPRPSLFPPWAIDLCIASHLEYAQGSSRGPVAPRYPHRLSPDLRPWTRNAVRSVHIVA